MSQLTGQQATGFSRIWQQDSTCLGLHGAEVAELREVNRGDRMRLLHAWRRLCVQGEVGRLSGAAVVFAALTVGKF